MYADSRTSGSMLPFPAPSLSSAALNAGLAKVIDSIITIASDETDALKNHRTFDIGTMNMRKARLLHDYNTAVRAMGPAQIEPAVRENLKRMRTVLGQNLLQFKAHAAALKEIVDIVMETAQEQQNDGTYSARKYHGV